jgi:polyhydroxybutyrate depolymerase
MRLAPLVLAACLLIVPQPTPAAGCGPAREPACATAHGEYRIALPDGVEHPPALVFLHGWGGSAEGIMQNRGMIEQLTGRGYALVAPDGVQSRYMKGKKTWDVLRRPDWPRDDLGFLREVVEDAAARHGIDRHRVLLAGFSNGGTMAWNVACLVPGLARAYAPVSGALWEPMPESCARPVDLFHVHGWTDRVVPLEGRPLGDGTIVQGDVWKSLGLLRAADGCRNLQPETATAEGDIWQRSWTDCGGGSMLLRLHPGGHMIPDGWLTLALDWFEALPGRGCIAAQGGMTDPAAC